MDTSCVVAVILAFVANVLRIANMVKWQRRLIDGSYKFSETLLIDLDPAYIEELFEKGNFNTTLRNAAAIFRAVAIFAMFIPILQVSWILSERGTKNISLHATTFFLSVAGGMCVLVVNLISVGTHTALAQIVYAFNLDNWNLEVTEKDNSTNGDAVGWRVLELIRMVVDGMGRWLSAFEWICISTIFTIFFFSVLSDNRSLSGGVGFGSKWASLGLVIAFIGIFEFFASIETLWASETWRNFTLFVTVLNTLILIPAWLIVLGLALPHVKNASETSKYEVSQVSSMTMPGISTVGSDTMPLTASLEMTGSLETTANGTDVI
jgi:hypothetical protein